MTRVTRIDYGLPVSLISNIPAETDMGMQVTGLRVRRLDSSFKDGW
jgi:hypothetical protein